MASFMPMFILLKSNKTDKYLRYRKEDDSNHAFLQFSGDAKEENIEIQYVKFEVQKSENVEGFVHIRSCYNNKYWVRMSGDEGKLWIAAEGNEPEEDSTEVSCTLFKPVLVDADTDDQDGDKPQKIRLVHVGHQQCVADDSGLLILQDEDVDGDNNVFMAYDAASVMLSGVTKVESSVVSRVINNVNYNLGDSRVYNVSTVEISRSVFVNESNTEQPHSFNIQYSISKTMTWTDTVWTPSTISASMYASIPYVGSGLRIELPEERNFTVVFGTEQSESQTVSYQVNLTIPPRKKITMSVTATRAQYDVPFTCNVLDTLSDGTVLNYTKNDGLYTGSNEFDFSSNVTEEDL